MANKNLRILIADELHSQRLKIERLLNSQGYFRIAPVAPVASFEEIEALTLYSHEIFDLLIISRSLVATREIDLDDFCRDNPQVRHALIYDRQVSNRLQQVESVLLRLPSVPEQASLRSLMMIIDPLAPSDGSLGAAAGG